jgi:hypothetical protein
MIFIGLVKAITGAIAFVHAACGPLPLQARPPMAEHAHGASNRDVGDVAMRFHDEGSLELGGTFLR